MAEKGRVSLKAQMPTGAVLSAAKLEDLVDSSYNKTDDDLLGETETTAYRGDRGKTAYDHSQVTHAPSNAQKNSDITKAEIEAKLTGAVTSHSHATLATGRTIAMTGDVAYTSGAFNGSANVTGVATLANSGATAGTYKSVTVDAKGRVTGGSNPNSLGGYGITDAYSKTEIDGQKTPQVISYSATPTHNFETKANAIFTLTGNVTNYTLTNVSDGGEGRIDVIQGGVGGFSIDQISHAGLVVGYVNGKDASIENMNAEIGGHTMLFYKRFGAFLLIRVEAIGIQGESPSYVPKYYVASNGNDSNDGLSPSTAWKTLSKVNGTTLVAGDVVGLKRGDSWDETITVGQSGASGNPIVYTAYGEGNKPKIYGSDVITGWTLHSGNIYKATLTDDISQLFINDNRIQNARYPKTGYFYVDVVNSSSSITSDLLDTGIDYTGSRLHYRPNQYKFSNRDVVSSTNSTITISETSTFDTDNPFFLSNNLDFLTQEGEWYYNSTTKTVYLWTPNGDSPSNYEVRGSFRANNIFIDETISNIAIKDLELAQAALHSVYSPNETPGYSSSNISLINVDILYPDGDGVYLKKCSNTVIKNSYITGSNGNGILLRSKPHGGHLIENNIVTNIGLFENINPRGLSSYVNEGVGIFARSDNSTIRYNRVINTGYIGIYPYGEDCLVQYNYVENPCMTLIDGGGIYVWRGHSGATLFEDNTSGTIIEHNIVEMNDRIGDWGYSRIPTNQTAINAYYADNGTSGVTFRNNIAANLGGSGGMLFNGPVSVDFKDNVIFNSSLGFRYNNSSDVSVSTNITGNLVVNPLYASDWFRTSPLSARVARAGDYPSTLSVDYNTYIDRHRSDVYRITPGNVDFAAWQVAHDSNGSFIGTALSTNATERLIYNDSKVVKTYYLNNATNVFDNVTGSSVATSFTILPFEGIVVRGLNLDCIQDYQDVEAPIITQFIVPATSGAIITTTSILAIGSPTAYKLTLTNIKPTLISDGWSMTPTLEVSSSGEKTIYAWARDAAGNISSSAAAVTTISIDYDLDSNLIALYEFGSSGLTLTDLGTNSLDGTNDSSVTPTSGNPGDAYLYSFATNKLTTIGDNDKLTLSGAFTIAAWIQMKSMTSSRALIAKADGTNKEFYINILTNGSLVFAAYENNGNVVTATTPSGVIEIDTDHFIVIKMDDSKRLRTGLEIWIDDVKQELTFGGSISDLTIGIVNTDADLLIGRNLTTDHYGNQLISQLGIWSTKHEDYQSTHLFNEGNGLLKANW